MSVSNAQAGDTRTDVLDYLFKNSPALITDICSYLGLTAPGVRRHIDHLLESGLIEEVDPPANHTKKRGRPARAYRLSSKGRDSYGHNYDSLATLALREVACIGGAEAIDAFALKRIKSILGDLDFEGMDMDKAVHTLVKVLNCHGYSGEVSVGKDSIEICQYHCPIQQVASEFPQLCTAEYKAISELLGRPITIESSIIDGHNVCLTKIPIHVKK